MVPREDEGAGQEQIGQNWMPMRRDISSIVESVI